MIPLSARSESLPDGDAVSGPPMSRTSAVPFQRPQLPPLEEIRHYYSAAERERWFSNFGPCNRLLETRLSAAIGPGAHVLPVASCTAGLTVALTALTHARRPRATYVLVPSYTFVATVAAIHSCGLKPIFIDVDATHWHVSETALRRAVESHQDELAAILVCSTFGTAPQGRVSAAWREIARGAGLPMLVDSAAGFGSTDETSVALGLQGDAEVFSFHATKPFAVGEGGAVVTSDGELADRVRALANFGFDAHRAIGTSVGINAKMSELHAATALAVLDHYPDVLHARRCHARELAEALRGRGFSFQPNWATSACQFLPITADTESHRSRILARAREACVELRTYHYPLHLWPVFSDAAVADSLSVSEDLGSRTLSLPMANDLSRESKRKILEVMCAAEQ